MTGATLYEAGRWTVTGEPTDRGCVRFRVYRDGGTWKDGDWSMYAPGRNGWPSPRIWQRSVEGALKWAIRLADKMHRKDVEAAHAFEVAKGSMEGIQRRAEALRSLEEEMASS